MMPPAPAVTRALMILQFGQLVATAWQGPDLPGNTLRTHFVPAYFGGPGSPALLFLESGEQVALEWPKGLPPRVHFLASSRDGRAVYVQGLAFSSSEITKVEFDPQQQFAVPGTKGLGQLSSLVESTLPQRLIALTVPNKGGASAAYTIDETTGVRSHLSFGSMNDCGPVSPDGQHALCYEEGEMVLMDGKSGKARTVPGMRNRTAITWSSWSPDGRWIALNDNGALTSIDSDNPSQKKHLGSGGKGPPVWSPDSARILVSKSELSCAITLYGLSLEVIEVETGKKNVIRGSHCRIMGGSYGWLNRDLAQ